MERGSRSLGEVVGLNVRRVRERLGWSQEELRQRLEPLGISWSRPTVAQTELGKRPISVDELLALALCLGLAPHLLLYPPPGVEVASGPEAIAAPELARWLFAPDDDPRSTAGDQEVRLAFEAMAGASEMRSALERLLHERARPGDTRRRKEGEDGR